MSTFSLNGGYNYAECIDVEVSTLEDAAAEWFDRWSSNGNRKVGGYYYPCFGDMEDSDYAVINFDTEETLSRSEVIAMFV